jgi:hypothetical protein
MSGVAYHKLNTVLLKTKLNIILQVDFRSATAEVSFFFRNMSLCHWVTGTQCCETAWWSRIQPLKCLQRTCQPLKIRLPHCPEASGTNHSVTKAQIAKKKNRYVRHTLICDYCSVLKRSSWFVNADEHRYAPAAPQCVWCAVYVNTALCLSKFTAVSVTHTAITVEILSLIHTRCVL